MDFDEMLPILQSQASRIFNGNKDSMQDALAMAYLNYRSCMSRKNQKLSIGELVNFIKYRATELNNGSRPHFGNISTKRTNDVYFRHAYLDGQVERLSFDYEDNDIEETDKSSLVYHTQVPAKEDDILFNIDFNRFYKRLSNIEKELLDWRLYGLNCTEISKVMKLKYSNIRTQLKQINTKFTDFYSTSQ